MNNMLESKDSTRTLMILVAVLITVALLLTIAYFVIGSSPEQDSREGKAMTQPDFTVDANGNTTVPPSQSMAPGMGTNTGNHDAGRSYSTSLGRSPMPIPHKGFFIQVDKSDHILKLFRDGKHVRSYTVTVGANPGDKEIVGDMRTPEGNFYISKIEESSRRTFDEGNGPEEVYGPWFLRLETGSEQTFGGGAWTGIAIHGTNRPDDIGKHASHGCIRLQNDQITELKNSIEPAFKAKERIYVVVIP